MSISRTSMQNRLSRIEGQVRGLMNMIDENRECADVLTQVAALRAALDSFGTVVISNHVEEIAESAGVSGADLETLRCTIERFLK